MILDAARELLASAGYAGLSFEGTAARAGVGKTTIYRRWPSKAALAFAAVFHPANIGSAPDTGTFRGDLSAVVKETIRAFSDPAAAQALAGVVTETAQDPALAELVQGTFIEAERQWMTTILDAARSTGEVSGPVDPDVLLAALVGATLYRALLAGDRPPDRAFASDLVDLLIDGATGRRS